jgi:hypothetical protein
MNRSNETGDHEPDYDHTVDATMHPFHAESQPEPTYESWPEHIVLDPPVLCDEAAMQFSILLKELCKQFNALYADQIRSAAHRRRLEHSRREAERYFHERQMMLPMFEDEPEF